MANRHTLSRTLTRCHTRGPDDMHVGSAAQTRIYWLTCASKSKRACSGVYVRTCTQPCKSASISQRTNARQFHQSADRIIQNHRFLAVFTQWVCSSAATPPQVSGSLPPNGGNGVIRGTTRRRHTVSQLLMLQNPHQHRRGGRRRARRAWLRCPRAAKAQQLDTRTAPRRDKTRPTRTAPGHCGIKLALQTPSRRICGTKLALLAQNDPNWHVLRAQGELNTAVASKKPRRRTLYRMRGKDGAIHDSTPGVAGVKGAGGSGELGRASRRGLAAVPVGGGEAWPGFEPTYKHTSAHQAPLV